MKLPIEVEQFLSGKVNWSPEDVEYWLNQYVSGMTTLEDEWVAVSDYRERLTAIRMISSLALVRLDKEKHDTDQ